MAVQVHDHIHISADNNPPTANETYHVLQGTLDHAQEVSVTYERGITGLLHVHRLEDGVTAGVPIQFDADKETIIIRGTDAITKLDTLRALSGRRIYYVPSYHDDADLPSYTSRSVLVIQPGGVTNLDPMMSFWTVQVQIVDDSEVT